MAKQTRTPKLFAHERCTRFSLSLLIHVVAVAIATLLLLYLSPILAGKKSINNAKLKDVEFQTAKVKKCFYVFGQTNHRAIARLNVVLLPMKHDAGSLLLFLQRLDN